MGGAYKMYLSKNDKIYTYYLKDYTNSISIVNTSLYITHIIYKKLQLLFVVPITNHNLVKSIV